MLHGKKRFVKDIVEKNVGKLNIYGYCFDGFLRTIKDIDSYYTVSMELFEFDKRKHYRALHKVYAVALHKSVLRVKSVTKIRSATMRPAIPIRSALISPLTTR